MVTANQVAPRDTLKGSIMNRTPFSGANNVATSFVCRELGNVFRISPFTFSENSDDPSSVSTTTKTNSMLMHRRILGPALPRCFKNLFRLQPLFSENPDDRSSVDSTTQTNNVLMHQMSNFELISLI